MQHKKTVTIPAAPEKQVEVNDFVSCDLCGNKIEDEYGDVEEVTMHYKTGISYPEGGSGKEYKFDVCVSCWKQAILPFMNQMGANPTVRDWDW